MLSHLRSWIHSLRDQNARAKPIFRESRSLQTEPLEPRRLLTTVTQVGGDDSVETYELSSQVDSSSDDAEERSNGRMELSSRELELVDDGRRTNRTIGLRFQDIEIPKHAVIVSAYVQFTVDQADEVATSIDIWGEAADDASTFTKKRRNISSRDTTNATTQWIPEIWEEIGRSGELQRTNDLSGIINEIIKRPGWESGNAIALVMKGSGDRTAVAFDGQASEAPELKVVFEATTEAVPAEPDEPPTEPEDNAPPPESNEDLEPVDVTMSITRTIANSSDDASEDRRGQVRLHDATVNTKSIFGLRFQDIDIPTGSLIVDARIQFQAGKVRTRSDRLFIQGELADNAEEFTTDRRNISRRVDTKTRTRWNLDPWNEAGEVGEAQQTPNLAPIVQEIVDQSGWKAGNSLSFTLKGSSRRDFETADGDVAPTIRMTYVTGSFVHLLNADSIEVVSEQDRTTRYNARAGKGKAFDARGSTFVIEDSTHGIISVQGDRKQTGMVWAGGFVTGSKPWDASWDEWKNDPATRSSAVFENRAHSATLTGMHFFNVHDGPRVAYDGFDWTVENVWGEYIRDDAIESDHHHSGKVVDSLFDGTYTGFSTRPSLSNTDADGRGEVLTIDRVLLRLEAMPYPYKYNEKEGVLNENGEPWDGTGVPYGHGNLFKYDARNTEKNIHFVIRDSVFVIPHGNVPIYKISLPPEELIDDLSNVTIVYLGEGDYPGELPARFADEITILKGQQGRDFWKEKVTDWHERHPEVGKHRKPANPGEIGPRGAFG